MPTTVIAQLDRHINTGETFRVGTEYHEVVGFYTGIEFAYFMYSAVSVNGENDLRFLRLWKQVEGNHSGYYTSWELIHASEMTILDAVSRLMNKEVGI